MSKQYRAFGITYPIGFNPNLAMVRGIAVLLVLFYHCGVSWLRGGFLGVDIFFVLSGYLITCTLLKQREQSSRPFFSFYWNRFLRLFPAFAAVCLALFIARSWLTNRDQPVTDILAAGLYVSDWTRALGQHVPLYLGHTWSLAIEEKFYLIWPFVLFALLATFKRRHAAIGALAIAVASAAWRAYGTLSGFSPSRLYNGFDFRCDGLLFGCAIAIYTYGLAKNSRQLRKYAFFSIVLTLPVFAYMLVYMNVDDSFMPYVGYSASNILISSIIVIATSGADDGHMKIFSPLIYVGEISYGIYLWHFPIAYEASTRYGINGFTKLCLTLGLSILFASASFFLIERRALSLRGVSMKAKLGMASFASSLCLIATGVWVFWQAEIINIFVNRPAVIEAYGPKTIRHLASFNQQPDGTNAMWIKTSSAVPHETLVEIDGIPIKTGVSFNMITATVPPDRLVEIGEHKVRLVTSSESPLSNEVLILVLP
jgi:peptidoglycan/LPS O-acetylase OafA/YrhL